MHTHVVRKILTKANRGTQVLYVTGNHDEFLRRFVGYELEIGNIRLVNEHIHKTADGRQLLVVHGDFFDVITRYHKWIALAGDAIRSEEHTSELQSLMRISYAAFYLKKKRTHYKQ